MARKKVLDEQIDGLRDVQAELNKERSLAVRLAEACSELEADSVWSELERTTEQALFVRLRKVYSLADLNPSSEELNHGSDLELAKAERARDQLLKSMGSNWRKRTSPLGFFAKPKRIPYFHPFLLGMPPVANQ